MLRAICATDCGRAASSSAPSTCHRALLRPRSRVMRSPSDSRTPFRRKSSMINVPNGLTRGERWVFVMSAYYHYDSVLSISSAPPAASILMVSLMKRSHRRSGRMERMDAFSGPQFLAAYGALCVAVLVLATWFVRSKDTSTDTGPEPLAKDLDPYEIAYLRGGKNELVRYLVFELTRDGFLEVATSANKRDPAFIVRTP